jgi:hypothetical protein
MLRRCSLRPPRHRRIRTAVIAKLARYLSRQASDPHGPFGRLLGAIWG